MTRAPARGFTLVELLIALFAMSLLAVLSWRGLEGMARAQAQTEARADQFLTLQVGLEQWSADLEAVTQLQGNDPALDWNGQVLRLTRRNGADPAAGVVVAAWTHRAVNNSGVWLRWQSAPVTTHGELTQAWNRAELWARNPTADLRAWEVAVAPLDDWQLFYYRGNAWTNPQSSSAESAGDVVPGAVVPGAVVPGAVVPAPAGTASARAGAAETAQPLPEGIRLILELPEGQGISGVLTVDWARKTRP